MDASISSRVIHVVIDHSARVATSQQCNILCSCTDDDLRTTQFTVSVTTYSAATAVCQVVFAMPSAVETTQI